MCYEVFEEDGILMRSLVCTHDLATLLQCLHDLHIIDELISMSVSPKSI